MAIIVLCKISLDGAYHDDHFALLGNLDPATHPPRPRDPNSTQGPNGIRGHLGPVTLIAVPKRIELLSDTNQRVALVSIAQSKSPSW